MLLKVLTFASSVQRLAVKGWSNREERTDLLGKIPAHLSWSPQLYELQGGRCVVDKDQFMNVPRPECEKAKSNWPFPFQSRFPPLGFLGCTAWAALKSCCLVFSDCHLEARCAQTQEWQVSMSTPQLLDTSSSGTKAIKTTTLTFITPPIQAKELQAWQEEVGSCACFCLECQQPEFLLKVPLTQRSI